MSEQIKDGGPAFPVTTRSSDLHDYGHYGHQSGPQEWQFGGMTLRDYFAAKTLSSQVGVDVCDIPAAYARFASHCYRMADAMLAAREAKS